MSVRVDVQPTFSPMPNGVDQYECSGLDVASYELDAKTWAELGAKALKTGQLSMKSQGNVTLYGADMDGYYISTGRMDPEKGCGGAEAPPLWRPHLPRLGHQTCQQGYHIVRL